MTRDRERRTRVATRKNPDGPLSGLGGRVVRHRDDIGRCGRCGRWQRRRFAHAEQFGPDDWEEWCVNAACFTTWRDGIELRLAAVHNPNAIGCRCASCLQGTDTASMIRAAEAGTTTLPT